MYQPYIYLEVRVLLSAVPGVFNTETEEGSKKDILSAKADFLNKNNSQAKVTAVSVQPSALRKVETLIRALGGDVKKDAVLQHVKGNIQEPPDDRNFTGFSVLAGTGGNLDIMFHQKSKSISIEEIRIEEDCGHLTRAVNGKARMDWTYAGCPSLRLRTSASFELGEEAEIFLQELYTLMAYLKLCPPELAESCVRCNAYVAMANFPGKPEFCVKLRNLNSFNFVRKAINCELSREEEILASGGSLKSESRLWIKELDATQSWKDRADEVIHFDTVTPEVKVHLASSSDNYGVQIELPAVRRERMRLQYGLSRLRTSFICSEKDRADYFEEAVAAGGEPLLTAHWMAGEFSRVLNLSGTSIKQSRLTSQRFAEIMQLLGEGKIHSGMAKTLIQTVCKTGEKPETIMKRTGMELLSSDQELEPFVDQVLEENRELVEELKVKGDLGPLDYLTGLVMKLTNGRAVPSNVKALIKNKLHISVIYMFTMGGAISARKLEDGTIAAGNPEMLRSLIRKDVTPFPVHIFPVSQMLSEETEPKDWAKLICEIKNRIESGTANGVVVTHGTDTLAYTAALLFWLFNSSDVPIVITASSKLPSESDEAANNLNIALKTARVQKGGVYVVYGEKIYSPLNLKYYSTNKEGFTNWNLSAPVYTAQGTVSQQFMSIPSPDADVMTRILNEAAARLQVIHLHPGMQTFRLEQLFNEEIGVDNVILELYGAGTGNMRKSDYSLKPLLLKGRKMGCHFYCTSQQETKVDFSEYSTSASVWREGAVPMGYLTTESVVALYFASYLLADDDNEFVELMENAAESVGL